MCTNFDETKLLALNPLLHRLLLDHDISFYFRQHGEKSKKKRIILKQIWKMEQLLQRSIFEEMLHFPLYF